MKILYSTILIVTTLVIISSCNTQKKTESSESFKPNEAPMTSADNSMNSLDWDGVYTGNLPCADCEGIQTVIKIKKDLSYINYSKYIGKSNMIYESRGKFSWNEQGNIISLKNIDKKKKLTKYQVGENRLMQLDEKGNKITGDLADKYVLIKVHPGIVGRYWKLIQLNGKSILKRTFRKEPHIILKSEENKFEGNSGCNSFGGIYEIKGANGIVFSKVMSTKMICPQMEIEDQFFSVINKVDTYQIKGDTLELNKIDVGTLAKFIVDYFE